MSTPAADAIYIRARPEDILTHLTRVSDDATWWPGAQAKGAYGWVAVDAVAGPAERVRFRATIGALREWEGFSWTLDGGDLAGRVEWWLEPFKDGATVHHLMDVERARSGWWPPTPTLVRRYRWAIRRGLNGLKDRLEGRERG